MNNTEPHCPIIFVGDKVELELSRIETNYQLHTIRKRHRMSQRQVSELTGLSVKCISDIESINNGNPTLKSIMKFLDCFGYEVVIKKKQY